MLLEKLNLSQLSNPFSSCFPALYTAFSYSSWFKKEKLYYNSNFVPKWILLKGLSEQYSSTE